MSDNMFTFSELREIVAARPPGPLGDQILDELLDIISADFNDMWPNAPAEVAFTYASQQVSAALQLGPPGDGGGRRDRSPAPRPAPEAMLA